VKKSWGRNEGIVLSCHVPRPLAEPIKYADKWAERARQKTKTNHIEIELTLFYV
jgi:hypothetical protein